MEIDMKKSLRPKARPGKEKMKDMIEAAEQSKRDGEALKRSVKYRAKGGKMSKEAPGMQAGGKLKMVKGPKGTMVPDYAADGVGKMSYGGKMAYGGKAEVKKMQAGGMCRGMGAAKRGGNFKMG